MSKFGTGFSGVGGSGSSGGGEAETFNGDGSTVLFTTTFTASDSSLVFLDGALVNSGYTRSGNGFTFSVAPADGSIITIKQ